MMPLEGNVLRGGGLRFARAIGAGSDCFRLLLCAIQLANRVSANLPNRVLHGRGLRALAVFALVAAADERALDENVIALAKRCSNALAQTVPRDDAMPFCF